MPLTEPTRLVLRKGWQPMDADAAAYISAVETADVQALEEKVKIAIDNFVLGCKADGIWNAIKASCILAGARTLNGALVPLAGAAPTNVGPFVAGDYDRKTGLVGNGSTKYLDANRLQNADPQNSYHMSAYLSSQANGRIIGATTTAGGGTGDEIALGGIAGTYRFRNRFSTGTETDFGNTAVLGFVGHSRTTGTGFTARTAQANTSITIASSAPGANPTFVFRRPFSGSPAYSSSRLAFYSIGEALDLALLDARVTTLINAFAAAIP